MPDEPQFFTQLSSASTGLSPALADVRSHLQNPTTEDNDYITALIKSANTFLSNRVSGGYSIANDTWLTFMSSLPASRITLPKPPLASVTSLKFTTTGGSTATVSSTKYAVHRPTNAPGQIELLTNQSWTTGNIDTSRDWPVKVTHVCGSSTGTPLQVQQAVKLVVGHWYANREAVLKGTISNPIALAVDDLLDSQSYGFYG